MEYTILRSKRRTLSVSVREGEVVVRAPLGLSARKIDEFVERHRLWIARRVKEQSARPKVDFSDGTRIFLFGAERRITTGRAKLTQDTLFLPQENRENALIRLLRAFTREHMTAITEELALRFGFRFGKISVSSARTRWGSCNAAGNISYTFRTAFLPVDLCYYFAAHELCHTRHMDHSGAFWGLMKEIMPDCMEKRKRLKGYLWAMQCL